MHPDSSSTRFQRFVAQPLTAAILGGLIVLGIAAVAVGAGWVGKNEQTTVVQTSLSQPNTKQSSEAGLTVNQIYKRDGPGVVFIRSEVVQKVESPFGLPQSQRGEATGSGFVIDKKGNVLTNAHVVQGASKIQVGFSKDKFVDAKLVGKDTSNDVALLKVSTSKEQLEPLELGNSSEAEVGDPVVAIGNPFGLDRTVTTGIVSALQRQIEAPNNFTINNVIQTDAPINPGNSGGPLLDAQGRVIGMNSQIATAGGGGSIGIGFAVPINKAKQIASELGKTGKVAHAYLGITGLSITATLAAKLNLATDHGALVQTVTGPAAKAGVKGGDTQVTVSGQDLVLGGDVILSVEGKQVKSMEDVVNALDSKKPGDQVKLVLLRGSKQRTVSVKLGDRPQNVSGGSSSGQGGPQLPPNLIP